MSNKNSIQVAIKVRPLLRKEKNTPIFWRVKEKSIQLENGASEPYYFDHIFDHDANNELVFETMAKHIVHAGIKGFNGTIFAYGQTSSGKTYTMIGDDDNPGVMVLAAKEIFKEIERTTDRQFLLRVGYIEIYNEKINDLLKKQNTDLKIHETASGNVSVACEEMVITSEEDILRYLCLGNKERTTGETQMNERSSRSHAIFRIIIESRKVERSEDDAIIQSVLNLVDLAGSERADQTGATGTRLKEGGHINKSLLFLSTVIKRLSENEDDRFISFRDSKLTRILQASLGGNALTSIICTIKPTAVDETQSTLSFAMRAKNVKNKPLVNEIVSDSTMMKRLEREIKILKARLEEERNKNESQLKVGLLEKHLKGEQFKFITSNSVYNIRKTKENRRRTWCPNTENSETQEVSASLPLATPAILSRIPTHNALITMRSASADVVESPFIRSETFVKSETLESKEEEFVPGEKCNFDVTPPIPEPELTQSNMRTLSLTPITKNHNDNLEAIENDMFELQEFVDLERINSQHDELELDLKNTKTQLHDCKRRSADFQKRITTLEEANEIANKKIAKYEEQMTNLESSIKELTKENQKLVGLDVEFERLRNKSKLRENELLELLEEKNVELQQLQKSLDSTIEKHLTNSKEDLEQENERLHFEIQQLKQRIEEVQSQLLENMQNDFQQDLRDLQEKFNEMLEKHDELSNEYNDLSSQLMDSVQEGEELRTLCQKLETELEGMRVEYKTLTAAKENLQAENNVLRARLPDVWEKSDSKENQLQGKLMASTDSADKSSGIGSTTDIAKLVESQASEENQVAELKQQLENLSRENEELRERNNALLEDNERAIAEMREEITKLSSALLEKTMFVETLEKEHAEMSMVYEELQTKIRHRSSISPNNTVAENLTEENQSNNKTLCEEDKSTNNEEEKQNEVRNYYEGKLQELQNTLKDTRTQFLKMETKCQELELEMLQKLEDSAEVYRENLRKSQLEWQQERELYMQKAQELQVKLDEQSQQIKAMKESIEFQKLEEQSKAYENLVQMLDQFKAEKSALEAQFQNSEADKHLLLESNNLALSEKELLQHNLEKCEKEITDKTIKISELEENIEKLKIENSSLEKELEILQKEQLNFEKEKEDILSEKDAIYQKRDQIDKAYKKLHEDHTKCAIKADKYEKLELELEELRNKYEELEKKLREVETKYEELQVEHTQLKTEKCNLKAEKEKIIIESQEIDQKYEKLHKDHKNCVGKLKEYEELEVEPKKLKTKLNQFENELNGLRNKYAELQVELGMLQTEKNNLKDEKEKICIEYQDIKQKYEKLQQEHKDCARKVSEYEQQQVNLSELMRKSNQLEGSLSELQNKYGKLQVEHENVLISNQQNLEKYKNLNEEHNDCVSKVSNYQQLEIELSKKSDMLECQLSELQTLYADLQAEHNEMLAEKEKILIEKQQISQKYEDRDHVECALKLNKYQQLEVEHSELSELQTKYVELQVEKDKLSSEYIRIMAENHETQLKFNILEKEHEGCCSKLREYELEMEVERSELTRKSNKLHRKLTELQHMYDELKVEHTQLQMEKSEFNAEQEQILKEYQEIVEKLEKFQIEHKECVSKLKKFEELGKEPSEIKMKLNQLEIEWTDIQNNYIELNGKNNLLQKEVCNLKAEIKRILNEKLENDVKHNKLVNEHKGCAIKSRKNEKLQNDLMEKSKQLESRLSELQHKYAELQIENTQLKQAKEKMITEKQENAKHSPEKEYKQTSENNYFERLIVVEKRLSEQRIQCMELEAEITKLKILLYDSEKRVAHFQRMYDMEKTARMECEERLNNKILDYQNLRQEMLGNKEKNQDSLKDKQKIIDKIKEERDNQCKEHYVEREKLNAVITGLLQEKKLLNDRLHSAEEALKRKITDITFDEPSTSIVASTSPTHPQKRRSGGSCEGTNLHKTASVVRKNRRLSTHDDNRRIYCDATRDVGIMTDPHVCSCVDLELKLAESEKKRFICESQVFSLKMALRNHPLKEENDILMKRLKEELDRHSIEVRNLKKIIVEKTTAATQIAQNSTVTTATIATETVDTVIKANSSTQTEGVIESEFEKLQAKYTEVKEICRQRLKTIQSLEKDIAEKENLSRGGVGNLLPPQSILLETQNKNLKEQLEQVQSKYLDAKKVLAMRRSEIENLKKQLSAFKTTPTTTTATTTLESQE